MFTVVLATRHRMNTTERQFAMNCGRAINKFLPPKHMHGFKVTTFMIALIVILIAPPSFAITVETVMVGDQGNVADTRYPRVGTSSFGSVGYRYQMGKYEITAGQYTAFLNAVAKSDPYGLYNSDMDSNYGPNIKRSGSTNNYTYSVADDWANRPVTFVSWGDAARFANWLSNGQPTTGVQDASTTENGSYALNGATKYWELREIVRSTNATWVIPNEDEWYKAAYYKGGSTNAGYWDYPTRSDMAPTNEFSSTGTNNANFSIWDNGFHSTIGSPYFRTEVGALSGSPGPYGTFDQAGNVWEWTETPYPGSSTRIVRGGSFESGEAGYLHASWYDGGGRLPVYESDDWGFRLAFIGNRPPTANAGPNQTNECAGAQTAVVLNGAGSSDPDGDALTYLWSEGATALGTNAIQSALLSYGIHNVTLSVTDPSGESSSATVTVAIVDTTPPVLTCPTNVTAEFQDEHGATVTYLLTAIDDCQGTVVPGSVPPSGSLFPIGTTAVSCTGTDSVGNADSCAFTVTVLGARGVKSNVLAELIALRASTTLDESFAAKFDDAILHLQNSLDPACWIDEIHLHPKGGNTALNEEKLAANVLRVIMDSKNCPVDPAVLQELINRILKSDRLLAIISIQEAAAAGLNAKKIAEDLAMVAKGDEEAAAGRYANAIEHYRNAWRHTIQLHLKVRLAADGSAHLQFVANNSKSFLIERSKDMVNWVPLGTCTPDAEGNVEFIDSNGGNQPLRFYRAVEQ